MFTRVTWFTVGLSVGAVAGAGGTVVGYLRARDAARRHVPADVADAATRAAELAVEGSRVLGAQARELAAGARARVDDWRDVAEAGRATRLDAEAALDAELRRVGL